MPSRVVQGSIVRSRSLSKVSEEAELLFYKLIALVDDFGRYDADAEILAAHAYPRRRSVSERQVEARLQELANADGPEQGPVTLYEHDGRPYLLVTKWERYRSRSRRGRFSRWPVLDPSEAGYKPAGSSDLGPAEDGPDRVTETDPADAFPGDPRSPAEVPGSPPEESGSRGIGESGSRPEKRDPSPSASGHRSSRARTGSRKGPDGTARVRTVWPQLVQAAAEYGVTWRDTPGPQQVRTIAARVRDGASDLQLAQAIHGYVAMHGTEARGDFDPMKYLRVEAIFKAKGFDDRVDAGAGPRRVASASHAERLWGSA